MYKELKSQIEDRKLIMRDIKSLDDRISFIIQKELGLKGTSFTDIKVEMIGNTDDKFAKAFSKVEKLDKERETLLGEKKIIDDFIDDVYKMIGQSNDIEQKVFRNKYMLGLTNQESADRLGYSIQHIKRINKEIAKKMQDETFMRP